MTVRFPCKICENQLLRITIQCSVIAAIFGYTLSKINSQTYNHLQSSNIEWYYIKRYANFIPFSKLSNQQLFETNEGKKTNSRQLQNPFLMNTVIADRNSYLAKGKYFKPNETSSLINKQASGLSFFHLNLSLLSCHFNSLSASVALI